MSEGSYQSRIVESIGHRFYIKWYYDRTYRTPWEDNEDSDLIREAHGRDTKRPGEITLQKDRGYYKFYDFQAAVRRARKEWGCTGPQAVEQVRKQIDHYHGWLLDHWYYIGIEVTLVAPDEAGEYPDEDVLGDLESDHFPVFQTSLWGIESEPEDYQEEVIADLKLECVHMWHEHTTRNAQKQAAAA